MTSWRQCRRTSWGTSAASSRFRPAATIAAPSARSGRRADRASRCPFEAIRDAVAREIDRGAKEIVLTGVDITDYAGGLGRFASACFAAEPRLQRLRLSSLDSVEIDDALFELIAGEPRLMPHFHLSLQAGDDLILKRMKRRHSRADAVRTVERIKTARPDATIGADLIAGFPTETEEMALNRLKLLDDCDMVAAHVFPFSPRPDTPAARMPQVERESVKARAARLTDRGRRTALALARHAGRQPPAGAHRKQRQGPHRQFRAGRDRRREARRNRQGPHHRPRPTTSTAVWA